MLAPQARADRMAGLVDESCYAPGETDLAASAALTVHGAARRLNAEVWQWLPDKSPGSYNCIDVT